MAGMLSKYVSSCYIFGIFIMLFALNRKKLWPKMILGSNHQPMLLGHFCYQLSMLLQTNWTLGHTLMVLCNLDSTCIRERIGVIQWFHMQNGMWKPALLWRIFHFLAMNCINYLQSMQSSKLTLVCFELCVISDFI